MIEQMTELLREDKMNTEMLCSRLQVLAETNGSIYAEILKLLTHLEFDDEEAKLYWEAIVEHQAEMSAKLGRDIGLRVSLLDYFTHINKQIENPKIIEISIFEQTVASAMTDALTGIYNRRYFEESLFREFQRAKRYDLVMSIMMIDIDAFKEYNDAFGHPEGDVVLTQIGEFIRKCCRDSDIPCRYGGEEFVIIMPETSGPDGLYLARRISNMVKSYSSSISDMSVWKRQVTLSCGIASYPIDAKYPKEIVQKADVALYQAKHDGKDRSYLYYEERQRFIPINLNWMGHILELDKAPAHPNDFAQKMAGILVHQLKPLPIGSLVEVQFQLPGDSSPILAEMKVARLEARYDGHYDVGLNFITVSETDAQKLETSVAGLVDNLKFVMSERI